MIKAVVGPTYLNKKNLPFAADIFYHGKIVYFLPTGFHPIELKSVFEFPNYCRERSIALPGVIWEMCNLYFENSIEAKECVDILEPIRKDHLVIAAPVYSRDVKAIKKTKKFMHKYPQLYGIFTRTELNLNFAARELLSHVLYEVVLERSMEGAAEYLRRHCKKIDDLIILIAAVILNRIRLLTLYTENLLLYEHDWYPLIIEIDKCQKSEKGEDDVKNNTDSANIEFFRFRLFEQILNPIFGKCDNQLKNEKIALIARSKASEIDILKGKCEIIAREVSLMPTKENQLKQKKLKEMIENEITSPLSEITEKPLKKVKEWLLDFILDSTVIGGILAVTQGASIATLTTAAGAGAISSVTRHIINNSKRETTPSELLVAGMKEMKVKWEDVQRYLSEIAIEQLNIQDER